MSISSKDPQKMKKNIHEMSEKYDERTFNVWTIIMHSLNIKNENCWSYRLHKQDTP